MGKSDDSILQEKKQDGMKTCTKRVRLNYGQLQSLSFLPPPQSQSPPLLRLNADLGTQQLYPKKGRESRGRALDRDHWRQKVGDMCEQLGHTDADGRADGD